MTTTTDERTPEISGQIAPVVRPCSCSECIDLCRRNPGWMTPAEANAAIDAGLAKRLMRDWLEPCTEYGNDEKIWILAPASEGCEGLDAPECDSWVSAFMGNWCKGQCTFLRDGKCEIHDSGFKPRQCRETLGCTGEHTTNYEIAKHWDTDEGRTVVERWIQSV